MKAEFSLIEKFYMQALLIRRFEESLLSLFKAGKLHGTVHTCLGQEATAVGLCAALEDGDIVLGNHRSHGYFLARFGSPYELYAEIMGKKNAICGGRGGSQHLHVNNFYTNGIQGQMAPVGVGMALAEKFRESGSVVVVLLGDGTMGEGSVYEALNFASIQSAPVLFLVENNRIAQTTPVEVGVAGKIVSRGVAFDIDSGEIESTDAVELHTYFKRALHSVRKGRPGFHVVHCHRFGPHSKGDDFRDKDILDKIRVATDPLALLESRIGQDDRERIALEAQEILKSAMELIETDQP